MTQLNYSTLEEYQRVLDLTKEELSLLENDYYNIRAFFDKLAKPILKKAVHNVERQLRRFPVEARQFGDDSKLNTFEEICVMVQEVSLDYYLFVEDTIDLCCKEAYDELSNDDKFIFNHQLDTDEKDATTIIKDAFLQYALNYSSKRIADEYERRNTFD